MKVVAVNGSPNGKHGNTELILAPFMDGLGVTGAETTVYYTQSMTINPCLGQYACWFKTPGHCIQDDDMADAVADLITADVLVLASPV